MYNVVVKYFANGTIQLTTFSHEVTNGDERKARTRNKVEIEDEIEFYDTDDDDLVYSPWGDKIDGYIDDYEQNEIEQEEKLKDVLTDEELQKKHDESIRISLNRSKKLIYDYGRNNKWEWFFTFSLSPESVKDRKDYIECSQKVRKWINNIKSRHCPNIKYLIVPELHKNKCWHFHALISNVDELTFDIALNNQEYRKDENGNIMLDENGKKMKNKYFGNQLRTHYPNGDFIYNIREYKNGWSTATKIKNTKKAVSYIVKYITKDLCEVSFGHRRLYPSRNIELPLKVLSLCDLNTHVGDLISELEFNYGVKLKQDLVKCQEIKKGSYENEITYYEFE